MFRGRSRSATDKLADRIGRVAAARGSGPGPAAHPPRAEGSDRSPTFAYGAVESSCGVREGVIIKDVNAAGARIEFARMLGLPNRVLLVAPGIGLRRWAEVVWRDSRSAGLKFEPRR